MSTAGSLAAGFNCQRKAIMVMHIAYYGGDEDSGNVLAVETVAPAGMMLESHVHEHSHLSILARGKALVKVGDVEQVFDATDLPKVVMIPRGVQHSVQAITDIVWYCNWAGDLAPREQIEDSLKLVPSHD